ncbi:putative stress response transcription factor SrrA/Skn7 [Aspergillus clavatus NRRL 1]|uniref:Transcription factor n=1 Tax=Aspergillus clavatus (strain ATCC 1007 / CBS 513.65 / DSM 816 / NCTC 3887 / NRRL 1 / QM 1276 / 107) TaxID=344612 RepID=A1CU93_ASPCL|nr:stress response regulator/HFS transcription factor, putative [Aspergillus clavatus NRRL 1]EAW06880.1 stress response regulator/HFS transcription factor, putative [Aspergillus clavatus NRRL 1]
MEGGQTTTTAAPAGNSSDFVRKLYKMLEDPSYAEIVRWGDDGDSFVVLECEKFTKTILPKHFKHSNFASFVRQLNKYDFHKVRQNNEENGQSPYGQNAWEFKHPEFRANSKESLDNIRRKAPAPRKQAQNNDDSVPTQQIDLLNQQIVAQQQQIQHLSDRYAQLTVDHQLMLQELMRVQKTVLNHENVIHQVMNYLLSVDARQRRDGKAAAAFPAQGQGSSNVNPGQADDVSASPLQHASKLLNNMNAEIQFNLAGLETVGEPPKAAQVVPTTALEAAPRNGVVRPPTAAGANPANLVYPKMNGEIEPVVYPVGATNGIDPMYSEHVNNVPYPMPPKQEVDDARRPVPDNRKKSTNVDPGWVRSPHILLVEDDATCRQIGGKFLYSFSCVIDTAFDGLEAVNKIQDGSKYDLILMDIIMPNLDGVSACHLIRQFDRTPIIAMTSNIRSDDIQLYFQHGMDDVLPKPFTRKSLLDMLEKHLVHLKAIPQGMESSQPTAAVTMAAQTSATQSIKEDSSPGQSPAASMNNWQSPGQFQGMTTVHPNLQQVPTQYVPATAAPTAYAVDQNGVQYPAPPVAMNPAAGTARPPHRRQISEMSSAAESSNFAKRPRMYAHPSQPMINPVPATRTG